MKKFIKRKVDDLGRISLPIEFRKTLGIEVQDMLNIEFKDNGLFVYKQTEKDILADEIEDVMVAASDCSKISVDETETLIDILSKLV